MDISTNPDFDRNETSCIGVSFATSRHGPWRFVRAPMAWRSQRRIIQLVVDGVAPDGSNSLA